LTVGATQKRLGDGYYEQKRLREQVAQLTGRRFLEGYANDEAQYRALMTSAVTVAQAWQLVPGIALTAAQIAQLTSDIVWLIESEVKLADGTTQKVLAPQLYLAPRTGDLSPGGALFAANNLQLNLTGDLTNAGTVAGRHIIQLAANNIHNLGTIRADSVSLAAQTDLNNLGGRIDAVDNLSLQAGHDLTVASTTRTQSTGQGSRTNIDRIAGLYLTGSSGTLSAIAGHDLNLNGAVIDNAGSGSTTLAAGNNLSLGVVTERHAQSIVFDGRNHLNTTRSADIGTQIQTNGDLTLMAGNDLSAKAIDIQSTGNVSLSAGNDIAILAGQRTQTIDEATHHESKSKRPGFGFSIAKALAATGRSTNSSFTQEQNDVIASQITGQNLTLQSRRDTTLEAAKLAAENQLQITAGNDLNIVSAEQTLTSSQTRTDQRTNTFGLGKKRLKETEDINQVRQIGSQLTGKNTTLIASNDLAVSASQVEGTHQLNLTAGRDINILAATNVDERKQTREYRNSVLGIDTVIQPFQGKNGIQNSLGLITPNSYVSPGRVKDKIDGEVADSGRTAAQSQLSGGDIQLQSGSNSTLQAPVIDGNSLTVTAGEINGDAIDPEAKLILQGVKENRSRSISGSDHSFMWQSMAGQGGNNDTLKMPEILLKAPATSDPTVNPENRPKTESGTEVKPALNATGGLVVDAVALPGTAQEAKKAGASGEAAQPPATLTLDLKAQAHELAKQPGMAWLDDLTKRTDVDWKTVQLVHDNWDYKQSGLTPEGGIVVAIVVTILTWGAASAAGTAVASGAGMTTGAVTSTGAAVLTTTGTAVAAATTAAITTLASQAAVSLINNQGDVGKTLEDLSSDENIQQLLASVLTAGVTAGVTSGLNLPNPATNTTFASRFTTYATQAMVGAGVNSLVYGQPLEETAKTALISALAQSLTSEIGDWGKEYGMAPGSAAKIVAHAVVQCAAASVQGNDCGSAALGGAIAEALAPVSQAADASELSQNLKLRGQLGNAIASMSTLLAASLTGSDTMTALEQNFDSAWDERLGSNNPDAQAFLQESGLGKTMVDAMTGQTYQLFSADAAQRDNQAMFAQYSKSNPLVKAEIDLAMNKAYLPNDAQNLEQKYQTGSDFALDAAARDFGDMRTQPAVVQQTVLAELRTTRLDIAQQEAVLFEQFKALPLTPENMNLRADLLNQIDRLETRDLYLLKATQAQILDMGSVGLLNPLYQKETIAGFGDALGGARLSGKGVSSASINGRIGMLKGAIAEAKAAVAAEKAIAQTKIDLNLYRDWPVASDMVQYRVSQLAERATQNPNADTVILGKYVKGDASSYELVARAQGATYFEFPGKTWSEAELQLGVDKMWSVNKQFLDNQIAQGKSFAFTENPKDATQVKPGSFTHQEFQYLLNNGYSLVYEGGFYRAVKK
jgi:filamentous hemagglutinin